MAGLQVAAARPSKMADNDGWTASGVRAVVPT